MRSCSASIEAPGSPPPGLYKATVKSQGEIAAPPLVALPKPRIELKALNEALLNFLGEKIAVERLLDLLRARSLIEEMRLADPGARLPAGSEKEPQDVVEEIRERVSRLRAFLTDVFLADPHSGAEIAEVLGFEHFPADLAAFSTADVDVPFSPMPRPLREVNFGDQALLEAFRVIDRAPNLIEASAAIENRFGLKPEAAKSLVLYRARLLVEGAAAGRVAPDRAREALGKVLSLASFQREGLLFLAAQIQAARLPSHAFEPLIGMLQERPPMRTAAAFLLRLNCAAIAPEDSAATFAAEWNAEATQRSQRKAAAPGPGGEAGRIAAGFPGVDFLPGDMGDKIEALGPFAAGVLEAIAVMDAHPRRQEAARIVARIRSKWGDEKGCDALGADPERWRLWLRGARHLL